MTDAAMTLKVAAAGLCPAAGGLEAVAVPPPEPVADDDWVDEPTSKAGRPGGGLLPRSPADLATLPASQGK